MRIFQKYYYVKRYDDHVSRQNCGYVKIESARDQTKCLFYIMNLPIQLSCQAEVFFETNEGRVQIENILIRKGRCRDLVLINRGYTEGEIEAIEIVLDAHVKLASKLVEHRNTDALDHVKNHSITSIPGKAIEAPEKKSTNISADNITCVITSNVDKYQNKPCENVDKVDKNDDFGVLPVMQEEKLDLTAEEIAPVSDTKWEQLKQLYPNIHIFGEETETLLIKPQDMVVLTEKYQTLITNSFLLHGYYNYRQLLLVKWKHEEPKYYIGVPGNFYDREKNVAIMFGFESFENGESSRRNGQVEGFPGAFGYYLKEVEL